MGKTGKTEKKIGSNWKKENQPGRNSKKQKKRDKTGGKKHRINGQIQQNWEEKGRNWKILEETG